MRESSTSRVARWLEICFWAMGCLALGYCAFLWGRAEYDQAEGKWALEHILPGDPATVTGPTRRPPIARRAAWWAASNSRAWIFSSGYSGELGIKRRLRAGDNLGAPRGPGERAT